MSIEIAPQDSFNEIAQGVLGGINEAHNEAMETIQDSILREWNEVYSWSMQMQNQIHNWISLWTSIGQEKLLQVLHFVCRRKLPPVGGDFRQQPKRKTCICGYQSRKFNLMANWLTFIPLGGYL